MAVAGRVTMDVNFNAFDRNLNATINRVGRGTKKATIRACEDIREMSLDEVPRDTNSLASSFFYEVHGNYREGFEAVIGYGGNGDPVNPKTGRRVSSYMVAVHEDLEAKHPVGKAKFLEDPIRNYQSQFGPRAVRIIFNES